MQPIHSVNQSFYSADPIENISSHCCQITHPSFLFFVAGNHSNLVVSLKAMNFTKQIQEKNIYTVYSVIGPIKYIFMF